METNLTELAGTASDIRTLAQGVYVALWFAVGVLCFISYRLGRKS